MFYHSQPDRLSAVGGDSRPQSRSHSAVNYADPTHSMHSHGAGSMAMGSTSSSDPLAKLYGDRLHSTMQSLMQTLHHNLPHDPIIQQLYGDPTTVSFIKQRIVEVVSAALGSATEHQNQVLMAELAKRTTALKERDERIQEMDRQRVKECKEYEAVVHRYAKEVAEAEARASRAERAAQEMEQELDAMAQREQRPQRKTTPNGSANCTVAAHRIIKAWDGRGNKPFDGVGEACVHAVNYVLQAVEENDRGLEEEQEALVETLLRRREEISAAVIDGKQVIKYMVQLMKEQADCVDPQDYEKALDNEQVALAELKALEGQLEKERAAHEDDLKSMEAEVTSQLSELRAVINTAKGSVREAAKHVAQALGLRGNVNDDDIVPLCEEVVERFRDVQQENHDLRQALRATYRYVDKHVRPHVKKLREKVDRLHSEVDGKTKRMASVAETTAVAVYNHLGQRYHLVVAALMQVIGINMDVPAETLSVIGNLNSADAAVSLQIALLDGSVREARKNIPIAFRPRAHGNRESSTLLEDRDRSMDETSPVLATRDSSAQAASAQPAATHRPENTHSDAEVNQLKVMLDARADELEAARLRVQNLTKRLSEEERRNGALHERNVMKEKESARLNAIIAGSRGTSPAQIGQGPMGNMSGPTPFSFTGRPSALNDSSLDLNIGNEASPL